jgi:hypothetical protein
MTDVLKRRRRSRFAIGFSLLAIVS